MTVVEEDVAATHDRISGWVLKGSEVVNGVACRRFGVLEDDKFHSFRQREDENPSAVYPIHARCEVSGLDQRDIIIRAKGKNTFVAIVAGKYEKVDGYQFSVVWPAHAHSRSSKSVRLVLGFKSEMTAARWQTGFLQAIERQAMIAREAEVSSPPMPMPIDSPQNATPEPSASLDGPSNFFKSRDAPELTHIQSNASFHDVDEEICRSVSFNSSAASAQMGLELSGGSTQRSRQYGFWSPWKLLNGLAIYKEEDPSQGVEAFMVSCIVRSTPTACFNALMASNKDHALSSSGFLNMEVLDKIDEHVDFVHSRLRMEGFLSSLLAPREICLDRNWRKEEEDGTYIVVMKSSDRFFSEQSTDTSTLGHYLWNPIKAQVLAAVFSIAPLQEKYFKNASESPEALLTMVLKMDLGGVLSPSHFLSPVSNLSGLKDAWIESLLMSVVTLKDRVEQSRFVSLPFSSDPGPVPQSTGNCTGPLTSLCHWTETDQKDLSGLGDAVAVDAQMDHSCTPVMPLGLDSVPSARERLTGTCDPVYWRCPGAAGYRVRGRNYLMDRKKILAPEPVFKLISVDLVKLAAPTQHIAQHLTSVQNSPSAFSFVVQIMVPGPPYLGLVITWGSKDDPRSLESTSMSLEEGDGMTDAEGELSPFDLALMRFFTGDDETRNSSFKLIPHIVKGSFIIRQSVGSTPVLLGRKLKQYYFKSAKYIEVDIDVGSSYTAATVVNMVSGVTKSVVVDLAVVLEGKTQPELPESLLGTVRLDRLDLTTAVELTIDQPRDEDTPPHEPSADKTL